MNRWIYLPVPNYYSTWYCTSTVQHTVLFYNIFLKVPGPRIQYQYIPSLLTDFKISNFVTFSYSGSMKDYIEGFFTSYKKLFLFLKKKICCRNSHQCTQLKLVLVPVSARNLGKSYRGIFEKTPYMYRFPFSPQYGGTSEKLRENIFSRKCCCN